MKTFKIEIMGIVQGVGFRPFVYNLAVSLGITGYVFNHSGGVEILACGSDEQLESFIDKIRSSPPPRAEISSFDMQPFTPPFEYKTFEIQPSILNRDRFLPIAADLTVCDDCLAELLNPADRRYYYPFINCTNCGPRYTIIRDVPYDRRNTSMSGFPLCESCGSEYNDPANRRFHAQPVACHDCGPQLWLSDPSGKRIKTGKDAESNRELIAWIAKMLRGGRILAIKGLGGFHLACNALDEKAVASLRSRKEREDKPFAVMVADPLMAGGIARLTTRDVERLLKTDRPILLCDKAESCPLAPSVAPRTSLVGLMFPYTPLHYLIFEHIDFPLVMTSGNMSDEPIAYRNEDALSRLGGMVDGFVFHDRDILIRCDDSVLRTFNDREYVLRRSRGIVPRIIYGGQKVKKDILAAGGHMKNTVCLAKGDAFILSHHIGDLDDYGAITAFRESIRHLMHGFGVRPALLAHDLHPDYQSTRFILNPGSDFPELEGLQTIPCQHHHAHIVSCMAENGLWEDRVIGVAMDGTGYGPDGTIWGGEIMIADARSFKRKIALSPVPLPGGDIAIKKNWRMALSYLYSVFGDDWEKHWDLFPGGLSRDEIALALYQIKDSKESLLTTSCGRLFDGVAALTGIRHEANYDGQPAIELEQACAAGCRESYPFSIEISGDNRYIVFKRVIEELVHDVSLKTGKDVMAAKFHSGLVHILSKACRDLSVESGIKTVLLSGGCFMNKVLLEGLFNKLREQGLSPFSQSRVPCNDGGISLGQAVIADRIAKE
ncbi:MAG: carbamoyltransferase HypF [Spirochaetales bacterium]|nr:carbamoyltransferase HypF [Spirochaetales bacterium]